MISLASRCSGLSLINPAPALVLLIVESSSLASCWFEAQRDESEKSESTSSSPIQSECDNINQAYSNQYLLPR